MMARSYPNEIPMSETQVIAGFYHVVPTTSAAGEDSPTPNSHDSKEPGRFGGGPAQGDA